MERIAFGKTFLDVLQRRVARLARVLVAGGAVLAASCASAPKGSSGAATPSGNAGDGAAGDAGVDAASSAGTRDRDGGTSNPVSGAGGGGVQGW
jgi:hypothetical protein